MAFIAEDWSITRGTGSLDVRYIGNHHTGSTPSYVTTIQLHRALQDFADDATSSGDDELSIIDQTPSDRGGADTNITLLNGCNLNDISSEHIYDGSITQDGGNTIYDGIQVFGNASNIQIIQNGARIDDDYWNFPKMKIATADEASGTSHRFLVKVRNGGADIDGRRLLGTQREWGTVFTEFFIGGGTNRGNNVLALTANPDLNNTTTETTVAGWDDITNANEGFTNLDVNGDGTNENYYSEWGLGSRSKNNFYERAKWIQVRTGSIGVGGATRDADQILYGLQGDVFRGVTHAITIDNPTGTFVEPESISWTGGTGQLLAINSTTAGTLMYIQLLTGIVPGDNVTITGNSGATADVNVSIINESVSLPFVGASTGNAIIGAYGLGIATGSLTQNDLLIDLTLTARTPPNNVTYTVNNLVPGDYILATLNSASNINFSQLSTTEAYTGSAITSITVSSSIPTDIPNPGTLRLQLNTGTSYRRIPYTDFSSSIFTIDALDFTGSFTSNSGSNLFISYIDTVATAPSESATFVFDSPITLFTRVRNATSGSEIKTFETTAVIGSGGGSSNVGRISDV